VRSRLWSDVRIPSRPVATFERTTGPPLELLHGYRDTIKAGWRGYWWQTRVLLELRRRVVLPPEVEAVGEALVRSRTLPLPLEEIADAVRPLAELFPDQVITFGSGAELELEPTPTTGELDAWERYYTGAARSLLTSVATLGLAHPERALEIGCGGGYMSIAAAAVGVRDVVACDLEIDRHGSATGRTQLYERLVPSGSTVRFEPADAAKLPYDDGFFDLVFSFSVFEHIVDPPAVLAELRRVLRPGGFMCHGVDPWFSPQGGHSLCILDLPWGHVRLSRDEVANYLAEFRPHEAAEALRAYDHDFQIPRLSRRELADTFVESGFELVSLTSTSSQVSRAHRRLLTPDVLAQCRRVYPQTTDQDLVTDGILVVARSVQ
jgi:SAM-dependent methyltransferase